MRVMQLVVAFVIMLCMIQMAKSTTALGHRDDGNCNDLPQDILDKIAEYLKDDSVALATVMYLLAAYDTNITKRYTLVLRTVFNNDKAFQEFVDDLVKDAGKLKEDPNYLSIMAGIWKHYLEPNKKKDDGDGNKFDFTEILSEKNFKGEKNSPIFKFIFSISWLDIKKLRGVVQSLENAAQVPAKSIMLQPLNQIDQLLKVPAKSIMLQPLNQIDQLLKVPQIVLQNEINKLAIAYLAYETVETLYLWYNNKISGETCAKNIINSCAGAVGGVVGFKYGSSIGTSVYPGVGTIIGGVVGGIAGSTMAYSITNATQEWLIQLFKSPKEKVINEAFTYLEVNKNSTNGEINLNFKRLSDKYEQEGKTTDWEKLQHYMGIIRVSKGQ